MRDDRSTAGIAKHKRCVLITPVLPPRFSTDSAGSLKDRKKLSTVPVPAAQRSGGRFVKKKDGRCVD